MSSVKTRKLDISTILAVVKAQTGSGATGPTPNPEIAYAVLRETQPAGVNAAYNFSGTTLIRRRLNNVVNSNGITITFMPDVSGNFIIAEAGTYSFRGRACYSTNEPRYGQGVFPARLYISNETLGLENAITGETSLERLLYTVAEGNINSKNYWLDIDGILTIAANTVLSMKMFSYSTSGTSNNGGRAINVGGVEELYSTLTIQKLA